MNGRGGRRPKLPSSGGSSLALPPSCSRLSLILESWAEAKNEKKHRKEFNKKKRLGEKITQNLAFSGKARRLKRAVL